MYQQTTLAPRRQAFIGDFFKRLVKEKPLGLMGGVIVLLALIMAITADISAPYGYNEIHLVDMLSPPSATYLLGTDDVGRDVLSRIIYGARVSMVVGLAATAIAVTLNIIIGTLSGYLGGKFDLVVQRFVDAWMCFPMLFIILTLMGIVGQGQVQVIVVMGMLYGITGSRIVRGAVMVIKQEVYIQSSIAIGASTWRILVRHILPNIMATVIILFTIGVGGMIMVEATLSFLGFGVPPPMPSWGNMLSGTGRLYMLQSPGLALWPGLALMIVVYGINMFGDALRDLLDPRLRGGLGSYSGAKAGKKLKKAHG